MKELKSLNLSGYEKNSLPVEAKEQLVSSISQLKKLENLNLSNNGFTSEDLLRIVNKLDTLTSLKNLDLSGNRLNNEDIQKVTPVIQHLFPKLQSLHLQKDAAVEDNIAPENLIEG